MSFFMDVGVGTVTEIGKYVVKSIGHQLGYIVFYNKNKKELKEQLESLESTNKDVDLKVDEARSKAYTIFTEVLQWLVDVDNEKNKHDEISNSNPSCFNLLQRHKVSRQTNKRVTNIRELINKGYNFVEVGCRAPLPDTENTIVSEGYQVLKSKTSLAIRIKDALAKPEVNKVGVYGMGGVGKTYLLNEVKKLVLEEKLCDRVIDVTVGQSNDVMQMQQQIGDKLNKELPKSEEGRASFLRNILVEMKGNTLIILDDLWKEYDLVKEVGIPCSEPGKERCKVLMTSRSECILTNKMNVKDCYEVTCLDKEESWEFFKKVLGYKFDTTDMESIAMKVAKECGGLPLALDIIAKTLKGKHINHWEEALSNLENSIPVNIKDVSEKVYASLKLSYNSLDREEAKSLFLLCSVFPDDYEISVKDLQMYAMGMGLLKIVNTWKKARIKVQNSIDDLISSSLFQPEENYVKMHDIVRDVAIHIGPEYNMRTLNYGYKSSEGFDQDKCGSYRSIFVNSNHFFNLVPKLKFPKLELLIVRVPANSGWRYTDIVNAYFEGMESLKVLDLKYMNFRSLLWTSLKNLRTLCMSDCLIDLDTIIHNLKELESLKISDCSKINVLPASMNELKQLKVLIVSNCFNLLAIRPNIISSMIKLEELDIQQGFQNWGKEIWCNETLIQNAQLSELNSLPDLSILRVGVLNAYDLSENLNSQTLTKLKEFVIFFGTMFNKTSFVIGEYEKTLFFNVETKIKSTSEAVFDILFKEMEQLMVENDSLDFGANKEDSTMSYLIGNYEFTCLKWLGLHEMRRLESIVSKHTPTNPFNNLQVIKTKNCENLRNLFSFSIFKDLLDLQEIEVTSCDMMDEVLSVEIEDHTTICTSPLTSLKLQKVKRLQSFCMQQNRQTIIPFFDQQVSFPRLKDLLINGGYNLEMLWHNNGSIGSSFSKLQSICIEDCPKLKYIFPSNIVASLMLLDTLRISSCQLLETIFEIETSTFGDTKVMSLRELTLRDLPNLKYLWNKDVGDGFAFPNLKEVSVRKCPNLKSIFPASFTKYIKQIEGLEVDVQNEIFVVDPATTKLGKVVLFRSLKTLRMSCKQATNENFWVISMFLKLQSLTLVGCEDHDVKMISLPMEMNEILHHIEILRIENCHKLVHVFGNDHLQTCPNQITKFTFFTLVHLEVHECDKMMNLFSSLVTKYLVNLSCIKILNCRDMTSVVETKEEEENGEIIFKKLNKLELYNLPRLASFYCGKRMLTFPSLEKLYIANCNKMEKFSIGIVSTPKLKSMERGRTHFIFSQPRDMNAVIRAHIFNSDCYIFVFSNNGEEDYALVVHHFNATLHLVIMVFEIVRFGMKEKLAPQTLKT